MDLWLIAPLWLATWFAIFYYMAILVGFHKEPIMAHMYRYGDEDAYIYPLATLLSLLGWSFLLATSFLAHLGLAFWIVALLLGCGAWGVRRSGRLRRILPGWYTDLRAETSRQERHAIAAAWFRLSRRGRLRLGANTYAFRVFLDEIRVTVIYGARTPEDPWLVWQ